MKNSDIYSILEFNLLTEFKDIEVSDIFACDLLSDIIAHSKTNSVLVTVVCNMNTIAVAVLKKLPIIIFSLNNTPTDDIIKKANEQGITLYTTKLDTVRTVLTLDKIR